MDPFEDCIKKGRLKAMEPNAERVAKELDTAKDELERARACYIGGNWDETATQAYFAMFRCARAAINSRGYRDTNLYALCVALQKLYLDNDELDGGTVKHLREAKDIKDAVYGGHRAPEHSARNLLQWAQSLAKAMFERLSLPGFDASEIDLALPEPPDPGRPRSDQPPRNSYRSDDWRPPRRY